MVKNMIVAPHCDDEIIGCFQVLMKEQPTVIVYTENMDNDRRKEAIELKAQFKNNIIQVFSKDIPFHFIDPQETTLYFPDPYFETHPAHRLLGSEGEFHLRKKGLDIVFYTTNMNAPYIHEVREYNRKEAMLNLIYPSQKKLWEYENKYFLFEGYVRWLNKI